MKEKEFISIIKKILNSEYIGDDCAYLKDLGVVITQDSLVENVHFSLKYSTPYQIGYKSVMVNVSDVCASGAEPKYLTIALSLPKDTDENFVKEFYQGAKEACGNVEIVGGDITGSDKIYISVTAIGSDRGRKISSRSNAKVGYKIIVSGEHGNSATGLKLLQNGYTNFDNKFVKAHLMPQAQREFSKEIAIYSTEAYAMMDTSDGLTDALNQIAKASNVLLSVQSDKILKDASVDIDAVLFGGEDYQLVAVVPEDLLSKLSDYQEIGYVKEGFCGVEIDGVLCDNIDEKIFNHFKRTS